MLNQRRLTRFRAAAIGGAAILAFSALTPVLNAQRGDDWEWQRGMRQLSRLNAGTFIPVRTTQAIASSRSDGHIYAGVVAEDVWDDYSRLAAPAIPRGSRVELVVRTAPDNDLILDLQAVYAHGQRYELNAAPERIDSVEGHRRSDDRAGFVGGGAILGTVIGAIAGGGKGAAIGAAAGAATGLSLSYRGRSVRVPAGSMLTFRLDRPLEIGAAGGRRR